MSAVLELKTINKFYGGFHAVKDLNLCISQGEFLTLLGPSGSGKTTVLKMIAGFEKISNGEIFLNGRSVTKLPPYERNIGMVFQNYALFPHMTVAENVAFPLAVRKTGRSEIEERLQQTFDLTRMNEFRDRYPSQLSGGQQQRVALARAIVFDPQILIMDEPLSALDRNLREHMKMEIKRIQQKLEMTVVFVTHDQDEALVMSDRIAIMNEGQLEQIADGPTLYNRPKNKFVAQFVGESNLLPCKLGKKNDSGAAISIAGQKCGTARVGSVDKNGDTYLFIRPEHITLGQPISDMEHVHGAGLSGKIVHSQFLGEAIRYLVACGDNLLTIKHQNLGKPLLKIGMPVVVQWAQEQALIIS